MDRKDRSARIEGSSTRGRCMTAADIVFGLSQATAVGRGAVSAGNAIDEVVKGKFCEDRMGTGAETKKALGVSQRPSFLWSE
jgi:hypothetical protein